MPSATRISRAIAAAAVVLTAAACATPPEPDFGEALAKVPAASAVHGVDLPLDRTLLTPVEELEVIKARNTLMERCLAAHGLTFTFPAVDPVRDAAKPRRYGLVDAREAAEFGYRDPAVFTRRSPAPTQRPPSDVVAMITGRGGPSGGCAGEADRTLAPDAKPGQEPVSFGLSGRSLEIARTTPPVTAAAANWSRCMAAAGFAYADPDAAINDPAFSSGRASAHEIAVATQDVRCKERAEWVGTWVGVERAVQDVLIRQHADDLTREREHKERQLAAARTING